jgi:mannose-6-phosphate isomerase-like protein (cupin superfamily)
MPGKVRRIVTAVNDAGRSYILSDTGLPAAEVAAGDPVRAGIWVTESAPASNEGTHDPVPDGVITPIGPKDRGGSVFRIVDILPDKVAPRDPAEFPARGGHTTPDRSAKHPGFHMTDTVDYAVCLEGEIYAVLDEEETLMNAGDVLIQRGTYHAWSNRGEGPARMLFVLIDAEPLRTH